ncbi:MAG TPA: radical SAM/SPASM domain-containing protein [Azonexus sp.]|nr:radical SAM/SPASM domain-containing protein [Azonexus sp.]
MSLVDQLKSALARGGAVLSRMALYDVYYHARRLSRWVASFGGRRALPVFAELAIETTAYCNRHCPACPVAEAPRGKGVLDDALFAKILAELSALRYSGRVSLHFFNEPLLDKDIVSKVQRIAQAVPRASIEVFSNGDFLNPKLAEQLFDAGLSFMLVTAYNERALRRLLAMRQAFTPRTRRRIVIRPGDVLLNNRAGSLADLAIPEPLKADCFQPSFHMNINYKGEVVICSSDYYAASLMGNIADNSLMEIWRGPSFEKARQILRQRERHRLASCLGCNVVSTPLGTRYLNRAEAIAFNERQPPLPGAVPGPALRPAKADVPIISMPRPASGVSDLPAASASAGGHSE